MEFILILGALAASPFVVKVLDKPTRNRVKAIGRSTRKAGKDLELPAPPKRDRSANAAYHRLWDDAFLWLELSGVVVDFVKEKQRLLTEADYSSYHGYYSRAPRYNDYYLGPGRGYDEEKYKRDEDTYQKMLKDEYEQKQLDNLKRQKMKLYEKYGHDLYKNDVMAIASIKD